MGEEVIMTVYGGGNREEERMIEWEEGLPSIEDLTPLSQALIPLKLASAFSISQEPCRTVAEVNRASQSTLSSLRGNGRSHFISNNFMSFNDDKNGEADDLEEEIGVSEDRTDSRKMRRADSPEEDDSSAFQPENSTDDQSNRTLKRPRLVWTPQLHKRFVEVVARLGIKNAVPKTIMQMMNVEGLTRENVASHLQKYRLYLKRMQGGVSNEGPSASDSLFASTPVPQSLQESMPMPFRIPYPQAMMPMPTGNPNALNYHHGFESHPYNMLQQRASGNAFGSYRPHAAPNQK